MQQTHDSDPYPSLTNNVLMVDPSQVTSDVVPVQVVTSRDRYHCCHIHFGDSTSGQFYPAIWFEGYFYSLCFTRSGEEAAFNAAMQLTHRGRAIIITKIPKGYAVWVWEPDAIPSSPRPTSPPTASIKTTTPAGTTTQADQFTTSPSPSSPQQASPPSDHAGRATPSSHPTPVPRPAPPVKDLVPYRVLTANDHPQLCRIHLPQMKRPCLCICLEHRYYRLFQTVETPRQAAKLVKLLTHYNEQSVMTKMPEGYGIWRRIDQQLLKAMP